MSFDAVQLESAISSVIFEVIEREKSVADASFQVSFFLETILMKRYPTFAEFYVRLDFS